MKISIAPDLGSFSLDSDLNVLLYNNSSSVGCGSVGAEVRNVFRRRKLLVDDRAWDFLTIALSVIAADKAGHRKRSPDGWTRQFELDIAVADPEFWMSQSQLLQATIGYLTTDLWKFNFKGDGLAPIIPKKAIYPEEESTMLLSGGLDSFIGAIDLNARGKKPYAVGQTVTGDRANQKGFADAVGMPILLLNHNAEVPNPESPASQRSRSIIFLAYGVALATTLKKYKDGSDVTLYVCENGLISINPPLTSNRLGSLSTRTTNPNFLLRIQQILRNAGIRVLIENPYQHKTKGEMLIECKDQQLLTRLAHTTTSCGRYRVFKYRHCGRCVPCQIRRAAFHKWKGSDSTPPYCYDDLGRNESDYGQFEDVRAISIANAVIASQGLDRWIGNSINYIHMQNPDQIRETVRRGMEELAAFHASLRVP